MRVDRLVVHGFGRVCGREFRFGSGLTVVHGPNETGKSTLHSALSAALFGLVGSGRRTKATTALIEQLRPWNGERYAVTAEIVAVDGRSLRLEWDLDRGRVAVVDAATGADLTAGYGGGDPDRQAEAVWGVGREVYLRLGHVAQAELGRIGDAGGVRHAVEAVVGQGAADASALAAVDILKEHRRRVVGLANAATKPLPRARAERDRLTEAVAVAEAAREDVERIAAERDTARGAGEAGAAAVEALEGARARLRAAELRRRLDWAAEAERARREAAVVAERRSEHAKFEPCPAMASLRDRLRDLHEERERRAAGLDAGAARLDQLESAEGDLAARVAGLERHRGASAAEARVEALALAAAGERPRRWAVMALAAAAAVAVGAVAIGALAWAAAAVAVAVAAAVSLAGRRLSGAAAELDRLLPGHGPLGPRLDAFRGACARDRELHRLEDELARVRVERAGLRAELAGVEQVERERAGVVDRLRTELRRVGFPADDLDAALARYDEAAGAHAELQAAVETVKRADEQLARLLGDESLGEARRRLAALERGLNGHGELAKGRDLESIEAELRAAVAARDEAVRRAAHLDGLLAERVRTAPDIAELHEQLGEAVDRVEQLEHADAVLRLAEAELTSAAEETYRDLAPLLGAALAAPIGRLTAGRYTTAFVEDDLGVRLEAPETGEIVDLEALSHGTQRQAYLVQRLELARLMCPGAGAPPLLLDEPFAHFDADRMARTLAYLAELAEERQVILFATERAVAELAPAEATVITLAIDPRDESAVRAASPPEALQG